MGDNTPTDAAEFHRAYDSRTASIGVARGDVDGWLERHRYDDGSRERVALVVSEMLSNAVEATDAPLDMTVAAAGDHRVSITVRNDLEGGSIPSRGDWGPDDVLAARGRGLAIVDALADSVDVDEQSGHVTITAVLQVDRT